MENIIFMSIFFILGVSFFCFSRHKVSFEKTVNVQGIDTAKKKFRIIRLCGYVLMVGSGVLGILSLLF